MNYKTFNYMKKRLSILLITAFLLASPLILLAQAPPHPNGGNAPGSGNGPVGGGAPIGSGLTILITLGVVYGMHKLYHMRNIAVVAE
jgi:hypothetical protein